MNPPAERRMQDDAPIARLVLAALHDKPLVRGHRARALALSRNESDQVALGALVEPIGAQSLPQGRRQGEILPV